MTDAVGQSHRKPFRLLLAGEEAFKDRLSPEQQQALIAWHGLAAEHVWQYYARRPEDRVEVPSNIQQFVCDMESAIELGIPYRGRAYRGVAARNPDADEMKYLRSLIDACDEIVFEAPASASHLETIGRGWMRCGPEDGERHLAVLLILECQTARCFPSIQHDAGDESEVIIARGTRFRKIDCRRVQPDPKPDLQAYEINLVEC